MDIRADEISKILRDQIGSHAVQVDIAEVGSVISLGDGIARVHGVERAMAGEMIEFPHGVFGRTRPRRTGLRRAQAVRRSLPATGRAVAPPRADTR
jgi:hypothetical protein